jgi:hypothetical protein
MAPPSAASMPPASASADQKLDFLMAKMCEMTSLMVINQEKIAKLETRADAAEAAISSLREELLFVKTRMGGDIVNLQSELTAVKITLNARDQQTSYRSIKLSGLPISEEEAGTSDADLPKLLSKKVYDLLSLLPRPPSSSNCSLLPSGLPSSATKRETSPHPLLLRRVRDLPASSSLKTSPT